MRHLGAFPVERAGARRERRAETATPLGAVADRDADEPGARARKTRSDVPRAPHDVDEDRPHQRREPGEARAQRQGRRARRPHARRAGPRGARRAPRPSPGRPGPRWPASARAGRSRARSHPAHRRSFAQNASSAETSSVSACSPTASSGPGHSPSTTTTAATASVLRRRALGHLAFASSRDASDRAGRSGTGRRTTAPRRGTAARRWRRCPRRCRRRTARPPKNPASAARRRR